MIFQKIKLFRNDKCIDNQIYDESNNVWHCIHRLIFFGGYGYAAQGLHRGTFEYDESLSLVVSAQRTSSHDKHRIQVFHHLFSIYLYITIRQHFTSMCTRLDFDSFCVAAVGQPWARLEQSHPYPRPGDVYLEPAHHHGDHMCTHHQQTLCTRVHYRLTCHSHCCLFINIWLLWKIWINSRRG